MELSVACEVLREKRGHDVCGQHVKYHDYQRKSAVGLEHNKQQNTHREHDRTHVQFTCICIFYTTEIKAAKDHAVLLPYALGSSR